MELPKLENLRAVIFDRDGTLNVSGPAENGGYILELSQLSFIEGAEDALRDLHGRGVKLFVFTQQNCVSKGLIDEAGVDAVHAEMNARLAPAVIGGFYFNTQSGAGEDWSKPGPGMLNAILQAHPELNAKNTLVVGDAVRDAESAAAAGLPFAFVASDQDEKTQKAKKTGLPFFESLPELLKALGASVPYAAYLIEEKSRAALLAAFPPKHPDVVAHHITHKYGAGEADVPAAPQSVKVVGHHVDEAIEVLVVEIDGKKHQATGEEETRYYHITLSLDRAKGVSPRNANDLLQKLVAEKGEDALRNLPDPFELVVAPRLLVDSGSPPKPPKPPAPSAR